MTSSQLQQLFQSSFNKGDWREVLQTVFGARQLFETPRSILLPSNDLAKNAFELGSLTTSDDRIIGLYQIDLDKNVWLERNKVSLRQLLRNVYKYDVDGAIVVFVQDEKWRLSFISEIKVLNDEGEVIEQATEPKRFTYLLGKGEKVRTPADRLSKLSGKTLTLNDILDAFSVEALNEEFYKIIQGFFYELVGGKVGKGRRQTDYGEGILNLPKNRDTSHQIKQEFAVRLIGRTIFCWFLKMKKSKGGESLIPESLLSTQALKNNSNYYHTILERLFFQSLNTPMEVRRKDLPNGTEHIPFLNGGLFEASKHDCFLVDKKNGISQYANTPFIEDDWFLHLFTELEKYNFTIDENSVTEVEVSVDPEMLGRIFENLLAEIDPDSGESARKATGSFYTPREIVDYMATESLVQYIHNKTEIDSDELRPIFKMLEQADLKFTETQTDAILDALDEVKILDPACGSGAFPMGVLQKIVQALQKLDPDAKKWKKRQIARISNPIVKKQLREKLADSGVEYARKIGIIQNSLYGVDIQPIAAEISKLRCFLSLIVDENVDDQKPNRGVEPLPNLEFKFVTADTLIKLPEEQQRGLFDNFEELQKLSELRDEYIQSYGKKKQKLKDKFLKVQLKIAKDQNNLFADKESKAYKLGNWNPFGYEKSDWFDPKWMFGVEKFDIVIENPPYVEFKNLGRSIKNNLKDFTTTKGKYDLYVAFIEKSIDLLAENGILCSINPTRFMHRDYGKDLRKFIKNNVIVKQIIDFGDTQVFNSAITYTGVFLFQRSLSDSYTFKYSKNIKEASVENVSSSKLISEPWYFLPERVENLMNKIRYNTQTLESLVKGIYQGIATGKDSVFVLNGQEIEKYKIENDTVKKFLKGKDIGPYLINWSNNFVIYLYDNEGKVIPEDQIKKLYPNVYEYLLHNKTELSGRSYFEKSNKLWFELWNQRNYNRFNVPKLITLDNASKNSFSFDDEGFIGTTTTYSIIPKNNTYIYGLLGVLNSSTLSFYHRKNTIPQANGFYRYQKTFIKSFPIKDFEENKVAYSTIGLLSRKITFLQKTKYQIDKHISNLHIVQLFEEVINAMVMELYFKEDFEKAGIEIISYVERDFESIEGKSEEEQIKIIKTAYQKLREKDNEIRNNIKLMDIKLSDIVMPIKAGK